MRSRIASKTFLAVRPLPKLRSRPARIFVIRRTISSRVSSGDREMMLRHHRHDDLGEFVRPEIRKLDRGLEAQLAVRGSKQ